MIQTSNNSYIDMEQNLQKGLFPVAPNPGFVEILQHRLRSEKNVIIEPGNFPNKKVMIGLGLILGVGILIVLKSTINRVKQKSID